MQAPPLWLLGRLAVLVSLLTLAAPASSAPPLAQTLAVPSYWYPSTATGAPWPRALLAAPPVDLVIINPDSGPGAARDAAYAAQVARAHATSPTLSVLGYVHTSYGRRDPATVHAEVAKYFAWYAVDGIFVDEAATGAADAPYYAALAAFIRAQPPPAAAARGSAKLGLGGAGAGGAPLVVLNPGTSIDAAYEPSFDLVLSFEDTAAAYARFEPAAWMRNASALAPARVWHCVHTVPGGPPGNATGPLAAAVQRAKALNAGVLYATNESLPNPYANLPGEIFWEDLIRWATNHL
jgi:hypothetical protein